MKNHYKLGLMALAVSGAFASTSQAAITLYDQDATNFSVDGSFNTFYVSSSSDNAILGTNRDQSRVKMGFLPNWIGFNFGTEIDGLKLGGRSSFWVTINDADTGVTSSAIDVRQFYATIDGDFGQVLIGKDFTLFSRQNIFLDEMLAGYGAVNDTLGLIDGQGVSFGNIGSGYYYPFPHSQITYRTPNYSGFQVALGLVDPGNASEDPMAEESMPRFEGEATYNGSFDGGSFTVFAGFLSQESKSDDSTIGAVQSTGFSYGAKVKVGGLSLYASGVSGEGIGFLLGPGTDSTGLGLTNLIVENGSEVDSDGTLVQAAYTAGKSRFVASYGETEVDASTQWKMNTTQFGWFYSINPKLTSVIEFNNNELSIGGATEDTDTLAVGLMVNF